MFLPLSSCSLETEHHNYLLTDPALNNKEAQKMPEILLVLYDQKWLERQTGQGRGRSAFSLIKLKNNIFFLVS